MASHSNDLGLALSNYISLLVKLSDLYSGLVAVHEWHVAVHHYQVIGSLRALVLLDILLDLFEGLKTILSEVTNLIAILELDAVLQNNHGCIDIEALVVNNKNSLSFIRWSLLHVFENLESDRVQVFLLANLLIHFM